MANTLNNLGGVYSLDQHMKEAVDARKEAVEIYRDLAKADQAAYQSYEVEALDNLAFLQISINELNQAKTNVDEALQIKEELWKTNPELMGNELARSLVMDAIVLNKKGLAGLEPCSLTRRAKEVANDQDLKSYAADLAKSYCAF